MFVGRKRELKKLNEMYARSSFEMAVFYGRRRVGKTTLINEFCKNKKTIYFVGLESTEKENLRSFSKEVWKIAEPNGDMPPFQNFEVLFEYVAKLAEEERIILVIDEYPYLAAAYPAVSSVLQACIDRKMKNGHLFLILCGSSMSFMEHQVLGYKSPLYGRRTSQFKIVPFDFWDARQMLPDFSPEEQAILYGVCGGIPEYLSHIDIRKGIDENLKDLFFDTSGRLFEETSNLLKQELRDPSSYNAVLTAIAGGHSKLNDIATAVGLTTSACSNLLVSLMELGLVQKEYPITEKTGRKTIYSFSDQMFRFSFRFVKPNISVISAGYGEQLYDSQIKTQIPDFMGTVFEIMCKDWFFHQLGKGTLPFFFSDIGRWWGGNPVTRKQEEIDLAAISDHQIILAECKWRNEVADETVLRKLQEKSILFSYRNKYLYIFSKSGFDDKCQRIMNEAENIRLISFENMLSV